LELAGSQINGPKADMSRIDFAATKGSVEVWDVVNADDVPHHFHIHDVQFQVLTVGGAAPPPELGGWKDTIYTPPGVHLKLAMRFADYAGPTAPYMYHCHVLWHEDNGLMGQFVVTEPGQPVGPLHGQHH
jgi:FtsP/CotA-like multicopper oxidase with cupredoxin domain